jgi:hypothetical protein
MRTYCKVYPEFTEGNPTRGAKFDDINSNFEVERLRSAAAAPPQSGGGRQVISSSAFWIYVSDLAK